MSAGRSGTRNRPGCRWRHSPDRALSLRRPPAEGGLGRTANPTTPPPRRADVSGALPRPAASTICGGSWTRSSTSTAPAFPGATCHTISHRGRRSTATSPPGRRTASSTSSTVCCGNWYVRPRVATPKQGHASWTRRASRPVSDSERVPRCTSTISPGSAGDRRPAVRGAGGEAARRRADGGSGSPERGAPGRVRDPGGGGGVAPPPGPG